MTIPVRTGMSLSEFIDEMEQQPFEFINGEKRAKLPNVFGHSEALRSFFRKLDAFVLAHALGEAYSETTFIMPDASDPDWVTGSRIPDIMFYSGSRIAEYKAAYPDFRSRPLALVPDFVAEIVSPGDRYSDLDEKIDAYLEDGVRLIWIIDPQRRKAVIYAPDNEQPHHVSSDGVLDGGDVLPGFSIRLADLFA